LTWYHTGLFKKTKTKGINYIKYSWVNILPPLPRNSTFEWEFKIPFLIYHPTKVARFKKGRTQKKRKIKGEGEKVEEERKRKGKGKTSRFNFSYAPH
jgi:hypothetical protein